MGFFVGSVPIFEVEPCGVVGPKIAGDPGGGPTLLIVGIPTGIHYGPKDVPVQKLGIIFTSRDAVIEHRLKDLVLRPSMWIRHFERHKLKYATCVRLDYTRL